MDFFTSSNPHFFKVIVPHILIQQKLDLPKKFLEKNDGDSMSYNMATLKLPDGATWEVELEKSNGKVSFAEGWSEFMKFYSVKLGYFLVFRLQGNWCFDVVIFDLSATEIDYPMKHKILHRLRKDHSRGVDGRVLVNVQKSENEDDDDGDDHEMKMERKREKDQEVVYSKEKIRKTKRKNTERSTLHQRFNDEDQDEDLGIDNSKRHDNLKGLASNYGEDGRSGPVSGHSRTMPQPMTENQERVLKAATSFKLRTKNPSFMVTMRPSYIYTGHYLSLPKNFAKRYLKESTEVMLELAGETMIWSVSCKVRLAYTRLRTELKEGWKRFAMDNELHEGDICVFELMNKIPQVKFKVTIFRLPTN